MARAAKPAIVMAATEVHVQKIHIRSADGAESDATVFTTEELSPKALVIGTPAIGVPASYYEPLARELARHGFCVVTAELRGIGSSRLRARRGVDFGYRELVERDLPAVIAAARTLCPSVPLFLLGHSIGAHISAMHTSTHPDAVRGLVYAAAGTAYYKSFGFRGGLVLRGIARFVRATAKLLGYFPGPIFGLFGTEARQLMIEWSVLALRGRFEAAGAAHDYERTLPGVTAPILALSFEGDFFAPQRAVQHLLSKTPGAVVTRVHLRAADVGADRLDHFRWTKYPAPIAALVARWIDETLAVSAPATDRSLSAPGAAIIRLAANTERA